MDYTRNDYKKGLVTGILTIAGVMLLVAAVDNFDQIKAKTGNFINCLYATHIYEQDTDAGVTIDGLTIKDGVITSASPISGYQTLAVPAAAGRLAALDISGQVYDAGLATENFIQTTVPSLHGNLALLTSAGAVYDSGVYIGDIGGDGGGVIYEKTIGTTGSGADYECDGTADQTEFASAISALVDGEDLRVLPGTYKFSDTLTVDKAITIDGGDRASTVIQIDGNFRGIVATDSIALQHVTLTATANQTLDDWPSEYVCPLIELKANGCIVHGNSFLGGLGVYAHYGYHRITENTFNNYSGASGVGLAISYSDSIAVAPREGYIGIQPKYNVVERNIFGYGDYIKRGVYIENQVQTTSIANNFFKAIVGIESDSTFDYSTIKGNSLYCTTALIDLADSDNTVISGNVQEGSDPTDGIIIGGSNNSITANVFNNVTTDYIRLITGTSKTTVVGNTALGGSAPSGGITEVGTADYNAFASNANLGKYTLLGAHSTLDDGKVAGPASSVNNQLAAFDGATGKLLQATALYSDQMVQIASPAQGDVIYYDGAAWAALVAGDSGQYLKTQGAGANPIWDSPAGSGDVTGPASSVANQLAAFDGTTGKLLQATALYSTEVVSASSPSNGDILYYNSGWQKLAKGSDGEYLKLASGVPSWAAGGGGATIDDTAWTGANWTSTANGISADKLEGALGLVGVNTLNTTLTAADDEKIIKAEVSYSFNNSTLDAYASNLQYYHRFQDNGDDDVNSNDITWYNTPAYEASGKSGKAIDLESGSSQYGKIAHTSGLLPTATLTYSCWVKLESTGADRVLLRSYGTSQSNFDIEILSAGTVYFTVFDSGGTDRTTTSAVDLSTGTWYHLAFVADGTDLRIYINGTQSGTPAACTSIRAQSGGYLYVGANQLGSAPFDGLIDEDVFWNTNLSSGAITAHYNSTVGRYYAATNAYTLATEKISDLARPRAAATVKTSTYSVTSAECDGRLFSNYGDGDGVELDLPAIAEGLIFTAIVEAGQTLTIDPNGTDQIFGLTNAGGDCITNATIGGTVTLRATARGWYVLSSYGTWADGN